MESESCESSSLLSSSISRSQDDVVVSDDGSVVGTMGILVVDGDHSDGTVVSLVSADSVVLSSSRLRVVSSRDDVVFSDHDSVVGTIGILVVDGNKSDLGDVALGKKDPVVVSSSDSVVVSSPDDVVVSIDGLVVGTIGILVVDGDHSDGTVVSLVSDDSVVLSLVDSEVEVSLSEAVVVSSRDGVVVSNRGPRVGTTGIFVVDGHKSHPGDVPRVIEESVVVSSSESVSVTFRVGVVVSNDGSVVGTIGILVVDGDHSDLGDERPEDEPVVVSLSESVVVTSEDEVVVSSDGSVVGTIGILVVDGDHSDGRVVSLASADSVVVSLSEVVVSLVDSEVEVSLSDAVVVSSRDGVVVSNRGSRVGTTGILVVDGNKSDLGDVPDDSVVVSASAVVVVSSRDVVVSDDLPVVGTIGILVVDGDHSDGTVVSLVSADSVVVSLSEVVVSLVDSEVVDSLSEAVVVSSGEEVVASDDGPLVETIGILVVDGDHSDGTVVSLVSDDSVVVSPSEAVVVSSDDGEVASDDGSLVGTVGILVVEGNKSNLGDVARVITDSVVVPSSEIEVVISQIGLVVSDGELLVGTTGSLVVDGNRSTSGDELLVTDSVVDSPSASVVLAFGQNQGLREGTEGILVLEGQFELGDVARVTTDSVVVSSFQSRVVSSREDVVVSIAASDVGIIGILVVDGSTSNLGDLRLGKNELVVDSSSEVELVTSEDGVVLSNAGLRVGMTGSLVDDGNKSNFGDVPLGKNEPVVDSLSESVVLTSQVDAVVPNDGPLVGTIGIRVVEGDQLNLGDVRRLMIDSVAVSSSWSRVVRSFQPVVTSFDDQDP